MKLCDLHTHSNNSFDAKNSVDEMCKSAIDMGLFAIAITDHCEAPMIKCGSDCEYGCFDTLIPKSIKDTLSAKQKYSDKIKVLCGVELGEPMHDPDCTKRALAYGNYDFILASVHNLKDCEDFYYIDFSKVNINEILTLYFDELAETAAFEHFDSLAHLTYPLRYILASTGNIPDLTPYYEQIDNIFNILIRNNKALEINVSGIFKELKTTLPDEALVKRFHDLGGKYITIGTDSHSIDFVGKGIEEGIAVAKRAGFTQYAIYENRQPVMIDID